MSDLNVAPGGDGAPAPVVITPADSNATYSDARAAGRALAQARWKQDNPDKPAEPAAEAAPEPPKELAETPTDAQAQPDPVETTETPEPAELPPIEPPRSWTKDEKDEFATYPREAQEKIARREQDRESALRRSQNEAAEKLKGLTAKEQAAEQARQQYESALPQLVETLQNLHAGEFSDIKTMSDVTRLAEQDWPRYAKWDAQQKQIAAVQQEYQSTRQRQAQEQRTKFTEFSAKADARALEMLPELADKAKQTQVADTLVAMVEKAGLPKEEFARAWNGEGDVSLRHEAMQVIMAKAALYDLAKANAAKPAPKPVPHVQKPGVSKAPTSAADAEIQNLQKTFERNPNAKNAAALLNARRSA